MAEIFGRSISRPKQFGISVLLVATVSILCYALTDFIGYRVAALLLLLTVSLTAITFDILPVLFTATLSAAVWDFFFIPPRFRFHVNTTDDAILLIMYFVIALVNAVLSFKIRQVEKISRQREERANAIKLYNTFLNSLSHELRTPIAAIIGATDNLQAGNINLMEEHRGQLIAEISKASLRLNQQVENLLNMSRLDSGFLQPKKDWCDLSEIIHDTVHEIEENCIDQTIHINLEPDIPLFKVDKGMLQQIIFNLVSNACIHTAPGTNISITTASQASALRLIIEDDGVGFPQDELEFVFDKFYRLKQSQTNGTGLGLSIVKGFTEALGGTISLQNISSGGCRFNIEIPAETSYLKV